MYLHYRTCIFYASLVLEILNLSDLSKAGKAPGTVFIHDLLQNETCRLGFLELLFGEVQDGLEVEVFAFNPSDLIAIGLATLLQGENFGLVVLLDLLEALFASVDVVLSTLELFVGVDSVDEQTEKNQINKNVDDVNH
jgi:hypothetical protein